MQGAERDGQAVLCLVVGSPAKDGCFILLRRKLSYRGDPYGVGASTDLFVGVEAYGIEWSNKSRIALHHYCIF